MLSYSAQFYFCVSVLTLCNIILLCILCTSSFMGLIRYLYLMIGYLYDIKIFFIDFL